MFSIFCLVKEGLRGERPLVCDGLRAALSGLVVFVLMDSTWMFTAMANNCLLCLEPNKAWAIEVPCMRDCGVAC